MPSRLHAVVAGACHALAVLALVLPAVVAVGPTCAAEVTGAPQGGLSRAEVRRQVALLSELGRSMFSDPSLSASGRMACASCHNPERAFGPPNGLAVQLGGGDMRQPGLRAVPSLRYLQAVPQFSEHFFDSDDEADESIDNGPTGGLTWDGRVDRGRDQARIPLLSPYEMANDDAATVVTALQKAPYAGDFRRLFGESIFDRPEDAFAGDVIGIPNHGVLRVGDSLSETGLLRFAGLPNFAPEILQRVRVKDPLKAKHLKKALESLAEEGVTQLFRPDLGSDFIVGAVGQLQFEVMADRLANEYQLEVIFEPSPFGEARWLVAEDRIQSKYSSVCVIRVAPGDKVRPAHSHPQGEEVIYIISGSGRVLVEGEVAQVRAGSTVLFPQGAVHMLHNTGTEEMKVVCFFAPPTSLDNYKMHEGVDFPD